MPLYRLIFPGSPDTNTGIENTPTEQVDSGDVIYEVGVEIVHKGKRWVVTKVPLEGTWAGEVADVMVWPAE